MAHFQTHAMRRLIRADHVFIDRLDGTFVCGLCGAVTKDPPQFPTDKGWMPDFYTRLTDEERKLVACK